jgi:hypothetical protein
VLRLGQASDFAPASDSANLSSVASAKEEAPDFAKATSDKSPDKSARHGHHRRRRITPSSYNFCSAAHFEAGTAAYVGFSLNTPLFMSYTKAFASRFAM